jgi:hypothetical protein
MIFEVCWDGLWALSFGLSQFRSHSYWLMYEVTLLLGSLYHYGRRSRGRRFPPIKLQETKNSASRPFTLEAKVQRPLFPKMPTWQYILTKVTNSRRKFGPDMNENPNYGREAIDPSSLKKTQKLTRSWPLDHSGCFGQGIKAGCSFFHFHVDLASGILHTTAVQVERP